MKLQVCDICRAQNNGKSFEPARQTRRLTVMDITYEVDLCEMHEAKWHAPLVELLSSIGAELVDETPSTVKQPEANNNTVLDRLGDVVGLPEPPSVPTPEPLPSNRGPKKRRPDELWPYLPRPGADGKITCPKAGCGFKSVSHPSLIEHMRHVHTIWYYSDESRQWRPAGSRGDVMFCRICDEPAIGGAGRALHERSAHPREHKALKAAKAAKPAPPVLAAK